MFLIYYLPPGRNGIAPSMILANLNKKHNKPKRNGETFQRNIFFRVQPIHIRGSRDVSRGRGNKPQRTPRSPAPVKKSFLCIFAFILHTTNLFTCITGSCESNLCE